MDVQSITVVIAGISLIVGVINSVLSSRRAEEQRQLTLETQQLALENRQAQLFMQVYNRWNSRDLLKAYGLVRYKYHVTDLTDLRAKYHPDVNVEAYVDYMSLATFYEGLGILVQNELINIRLVKALFSECIVWPWEHFMKQVVDDLRRDTNDPTQYDHVEYLYHEMKQRQHATSAR